MVRIIVRNQRYPSMGWCKLENWILDLGFNSMLSTRINNRIKKSILDNKDLDISIKGNYRLIVDTNKSIIELIFECPDTDLSFSNIRLEYRIGSLY